ncbi:MAG TPA: RodZ domain-containing protein [Syntrophomonas sp.]|nr:RodZ domain-containing protein [Syntrophomonas sp.]
MMSGFGAKLRETRERQGISLETVETETKIRKLYLTAMEEENFTILPPQVYALGFVKRYANFLKLDPDALSREFKQIAYPVAMQEEVQALPKKSYKSLRLGRFPLKNIVFAAAFLLLVIWAGNYVVGYLNNNMNLPDQTQTPKVENKNPVQNPSTATLPTSSNNEQLKLRLKVKMGQSCWILVRVDGEQKLAATLQDGKQQTFTANDSIYIKLGNAAAVDIFLNDKQIEPLGGAGQVEEKEFKK